MQSSHAHAKCDQHIAARGNGGTKSEERGNITRPVRQACNLTSDHGHTAKNNRRKNGGHHEFQCTIQPGGKVVPAFAPDFRWVSNIVTQAEDSGCRVFLKPNLLGVTGPQNPGMILPREEPLL